MRASSSPQWSASGQVIYFLTRTTGTLQVWAVNREGGDARQITFFDDNVSGFATSPVRDEMVVSLARGGDEKTQLYLVSGDGMGIRPLATGVGVIHRFGDWSDDGLRISFSSNARDPSSFDVKVLDLGDLRVRTLVEEGGDWQAGEFSPDGSRLLVTLTRTPSRQELFAVQISTLERWKLSPRKGEAKWKAASWTNSLGVVAFSDDRREFLSLHRIDRDAKGKVKWKVVESPPGDGEEMSLSPDRNLLATVWNREGWSHLGLRDLRGGPPPSLPSLPEGVYSGLAFSPDGRWLALSISSPVLPTDVWLVDSLGGTAQQLICSSRAGIPESSLVSARSVTYPSFDGRIIHGLLYEPKGKTGPHPTVVRVHGGPEGQSRPGFDVVSQMMSRGGYAVFLPDVRGSTGYGKSFTHLDDLGKREDSVRDLVAGAEWLVKEGVAEPARIAVEGSSYGGYMVLAALTLHPRTFACGIDVVGIANFTTFLANTGPWRRALRAAEYGDPVKDASLLERISPIHRIEAIAVPLMVVQGANDPRVPLAEAEQVVAALRARGGRVVYLRFDDEGHGVARLSNRVRLYPRMMEFLDATLGAKTAVSP